MRITTIFVVSLAFSFLGLLSEAAAKYSLCNKTSYTLSAAIGYTDGDRLATRGWWRLRPGQCKVVLTEQTVPGRYYVYAEGIPGHKGPLRTWSGKTALCVENSGFFNLRNQDICRDNPRQQRFFFDVEVTAAAGDNYQTDFAEASNFTSFSAKVAGVQRLLRDIGKPIKRIDGSSGRETRTYLAAYRKSKSLPDGTGIDDALIDALIEDANALEAKLGFFFCNKAEAPVWSAIAIPEGENSYRSRGWWKLAPGECAKVLKGELESDHYYVYGAIESNDDTERRLSGGDKSFCINPIKFDLINDAPCIDKDLDEALFRKIEIGGVKTTTFDFTPEQMLNTPIEQSSPAAADTPASQ